MASKLGAPRMSCVDGCVIRVLIAAATVNEPLLFPSLGLTAYLLSKTPLDASTSPYNIIIGHLVAVVGGFMALIVFGLTAEPSAFIVGGSLSRSGAAALALGLTAADLTWLNAAHAPAAATTLIVRLGVLTTPPRLLALMAAVIVLAYQGVVINRLAGLRVPLWR